MAEDCALAGLLGPVEKVFDLAGELGRGLWVAFGSAVGITCAADVLPPFGQQEFPLNDYLDKFNEFTQAMLDVRSVIENPPKGFEPLVGPLREAAMIAQAIESRRGWRLADLRFDFDRVAIRGLQAIEAVRIANRPDDPWAFIEVAPSNPLALASASAMAEPAPTTAQPAARKLRGRPKADYETIQQEAQLAADWKQARESGVYKPDFAKERGTTEAKLDALLDRVAKRNRRSDK